MISRIERHLVELRARNGGTIPSTSISITDLKALAESWVMGARKLPAAPALYMFSVMTTVPEHMESMDVHDEINPTERLDTFLDSVL